jgi:quercetin dioxygenase-like cupin family protein
MHVIGQNDLPFHGMSHEFIGAEHGGVAASIYFVESPPGRSTKLHRHPYDEIAMVRAGRGRWTVGGRTSFTQERRKLFSAAAVLH